MENKAFLADADGTLVNTLQLIRHGQHEAIRQYLGEIGVSEAELPNYTIFEDALHQHLGGSALETLTKTVNYLYEDKSSILSRVDFEALHDSLNPVQDRIAAQYIKPYSGFENLIDGVKEKFNGNFAVVTSGSKHHVVRNFGIAFIALGLQELYLEKTMSAEQKFNYFVDRFRSYYSLPKAEFITCDDVVTHKPNPAGVQEALNRLSVNRAASSVLLGDHAVDMQTGKNAGMTNLYGITHGFHNRVQLAEAGATAIFDSLEDVAVCIKEI